MEKNYNFKHLPDLEEIKSNQVELINDIEQSEFTDPAQSILKVIYSIGADGWPVGDLAYFVGNKSNPDVQRFILDNLMRDVSSARNPMNMNLSDDEITTLTRQSGETVQQYVSRLNSSIEKDTYILKSVANAKKQSVSASKVKDSPTQ